MTPKEKARDLIKKAYDLDEYNKTPSYECKKISLMVVAEINDYRKQLENEYQEDFYHAYGVEDYWEEVKQEIEKL